MNHKTILLFSATFLISSCSKGMDDYKRKSIATEAKVMLKMISNGAHTYYVEREFLGDPNDLSGHIRGAQFPSNSTITPPLGQCCKEGGKCKSTPEQWNSKTWTALNFAMTDPHYYSYQFQVSKEGDNFTASAYGDIDCDGEYSTYRFHGQVVGDEVQTSGSIQETNPLE